MHSIKTGSELRTRDSIAGWLHRVARNVCMDSRKAQKIRQQREYEAAQMSGHEESSNDVWADVKKHLDNELHCLPEKYRLPIILFHLEGRSQEEIGVLLHTKRATIATRLSRARQMLRSRLVRRGVTVSVTALVGVLTSRNCSATVPSELVSSTVQAAILFSVGKLTAGGTLTAQTAVLSNGAINMLFVAKLKTAAAVAATTTILVGGGTAVVQHVAQAEQQEPARAAARNLADSPEGAKAKESDAIEVATEEKITANLNNEINELVQQLGDLEFDVRERASERLFEIGEPALSALRVALKSADAEVVARARRLLAQIPRKAINFWIARLQQPTFDADLFFTTESQRFIETGEVAGAQPPLLSYYREAFGNEKSARQYYVALLRKQPNVFVLGQNYLDLSPPAAQRRPYQLAFVELIELEVEQIAQDQRKRSKAEPFHWRGKFHDDIAAVMVVHAATEPELSAPAYSSLAFRTRIQSKPRDSRTAKGRIRSLITKTELQKQMLRPVLEHCWSKVTTARATYCGMELFAYFGWNQSALKLARRTVELAKQPVFSDREANPAIVGLESYPLQAQFLAAHHLLLFGEQEDIRVAAQLLEQDGAVRVIARPPGIPRGPSLEVRELALMALARLQDQTPEDYGMVQNNVYCPVAHTAKAFYLPKPGDWPRLLARFLRDGDIDKEAPKGSPGSRN